MSYQVLARKWRPGNFDELVGQRQTAQALINALDSQRLHHAYLFTGTRGVGKTTIARILTKSLNCEKGITSKPCGECSSCIEISQGNFVDLIEIDAASKTKVEDTREMLDNVQYRPTRGRYKIYLIDEVHMLSGHSFNALLKTLEEPPPHVIFLLATTDPQKIPVTVLSRCLQFHLRHMQQDEIIGHLAKILAAEKIEFEQSALEPIAKGADGSMRDALSLLDQAIAFCGKKVVKSMVLDMLGSIDRAYAFELLTAICKNDASQLMLTIERIAEYAPDYDELMADWLSLIHQIAITQATNIESDEQITLLANEISPADLQLFYQLSLQARRDLAFAPHPRQGFEMAMLRILAFKPQSTKSTPTPPAKKKLDIEPNDIAPSGINLSTTTTTTTNENAAVVTNAMNSVNALKVNIAMAQTKEINKVSEPVATLRIVIDNEVNNLAVNQQINKPELASINNQSSVSLLKQSVLVEPKDKLEISSNNISDEVVSVSNIINSQNIETDLLTIELNDINSANWFNVVGGLTISGHGLQILLNSIGCFEDNMLSINYLEKVAVLLTPKAQINIEKELKKYFNASRLKINFSTVTVANQETPKERQCRIYQQAIEQAQKKLLADPQVSYLIKHLGATLATESIQLTR